jgi:tripartite-type tricarboxylate transporter receptor subunit TctC
LHTRRECLGLLAALSLAPAVQAQPAWPTKPVQIIVPWPAGGATDSFARILAEKLAPRLGQPVIVDNKAGASGVLGTDAVAKAAPDGHTLVVSPSTSLLINQFLFKKLPYNPQRDLVMVSQIAKAPVLLLVHPGVPASNAPELVKYLAANKGKVSYGSWGNGSVGHLTLAEMSQAFGAQMNHVPYKGEAPMLQDLIGGQVQLAFASAQAAKAFVDSGRLKVIGVTGEQRLGMLPKVPTLLEQGWKDDIFRITGWIGLAAPAATPKPIVNRLAEELRKVCELPDVRARILALIGNEPTASGPEAFAATYRNDYPVWERVVKHTGASLD